MIEEMTEEMFEDFDEDDELEKSGMIEEMTEEMFEDFDEDDELEDEVDEELAKVMWEVTEGKFGEAPEVADSELKGKEVEVVVSDDEEVEEVEDQKVNEMRDRLAALKG
eukprot:TRINITY_DN833_c0_g1_i5.p2 TRINITY_DN833_c0_g1~~TRINITY_DN833_c0_g1_i5.p2  ORF type:complete len:109 (-),score=69.49 TRINITY_DN833_c0_g1_i5:74-400(-)